MTPADYLSGEIIQAFFVWSPAAPGDESSQGADCCGAFNFCFEFSAAILSGGAMLQAKAAIPGAIPGDHPADRATAALRREKHHFKAIFEELAEHFGP